MSLIVVLIVVAAVGAALGALGRWILPGPDPMPTWVTIVLGIGAAIVGGAIGKPLLGTIGGLAFGVGAAVGLVYLYRRYMRRKHAPSTAAPVTSPTAAQQATPPAAASALTPVTPSAPTAPSAPQTAVAAPVASSAPAVDVPDPARYCVQCGAEFPKTARFCPSCGATRT